MVILNPIDDTAVIKKMLHNTFNENNSCDITRNLSDQFRLSASYIYSSWHDKLTDFDFTIGSSKVPVITDISITILVKAFQLRYPTLLISAISIEKRTFVNPITGGIITSISDYSERLEAFNAITNFKEVMF